MPPKRKHQDELGSVSDSRPKVPEHAAQKLPGDPAAFTHDIAYHLHSSAITINASKDGDAWLLSMQYGKKNVTRKVQSGIAGVIMMKYQTAIKLKASIENAVGRDSELVTAHNHHIEVLNAFVKYCSKASLGKGLLLDENCVLLGHCVTRMASGWGCTSCEIGRHAIAYMDVGLTEYDLHQFRFAMNVFAAYQNGNPRPDWPVFGSPGYLIPRPQDHAIFQYIWPAGHSPAGILSRKTGFVFPGGRPITPPKWSCPLPELTSRGGSLEPLQDVSMHDHNPPERSDAVTELLQPFAVVADGGGLPSGGHHQTDIEVASTDDVGQVLDPSQSFNVVIPAASSIIQGEAATESHEAGPELPLFSPSEAMDEEGRLEEQCMDVDTVPLDGERQLPALSRSLSASIDRLNLAGRPLSLLCEDANTPVDDWDIPGPIRSRALGY